MSLQEELDQLLAEDLQARLDAFEPRVLSWLLLLPEWTEREWPFGSDMIDQLDSSGLVERRDTLDGGDAFWVRDSVRHDLARYVRQVRGSELEEDIAQLAQSSWLGTLTPYREDPSGRVLMDAVEQLLGDGDFGEATRLTAAARLLGEALSEPLADAARRARWRIDRAVRTAEDRRQLRHYVHRGSVEAELTALRSPSSGYIALHLLGGGGTGKTMVIRHLCSTSETPVARIDFDHLDPRYPDQRPGEILLALAGELLGYGATRQAYAFYRRLQDAVDAVHEELASDLQATERLFNEMIWSFARFIEQFPPPVLLVLDTCEELAKLYTPGSEAPAIDRTFQILEQLHDQVKSVRFVFAGRRWLVQPLGEGPDAASPRLRHRPSVRVLPFTGFTLVEAEEYLRKRNVTPTAMTEALLHRSAAPDGTYSPFELAAYCEWTLSDPRLNPSELRNAPGDPLVERRIIGRVTDRIRTAVPVAAALGRFDLDLITPALRRSGLDPQEVFDELTGQEWVNVLSVNSLGAPRVIEVDEHLRSRILYVTALQHPVDMHALGRDAVAAIERSALPDLPVETVEAAIRLLPVADAGEFWASLERRLTADHAWGWAAQTSMRAGAIEFARADGDGPTILAATLATQAAARIHTANSGDVVSLWKAVERYASRHPDPRQSRTLAVRGLLGRLAAGDPLADPSLITAMDDDLVGSFVAAAQRMVADGRDASRLVSWLAAANRDPRIAAVASSLSSVLALWSGDSQGARLSADAALMQAVRHGPAYADWVPPRRLADRCRLTRLFVAWTSGEPLTAVPWEAWRDEAIHHVDDIDAERLMSLTLRFERGYRALPEQTIERVTAAEHYARRRPADWLHFQVRPLLVELVTASWIGRDRGFVMLQQRIEEALAAGDDPDTVDASQLAQMHLFRRHRFTDTRVTMLSGDAAPIVRAEAWLVRNLVSGEQPATAQEAGSWHGWWQCQQSPERQPRPPVADAGIPPDILYADQVEYNKHFGLEPPAVDDGPPSFDPVQILRSGNSLEQMAPGERGRAMLVAGEVLALRSPVLGAMLLAEAVKPLVRAGDEVSAIQATVLAVLSAGRADALQVRLTELLPDGWLPDRWGAELPHTWAKWQLAATYLYRNEKVPALASPAPELKLPVKPRAVPSPSRESTDSEESPPLRETSSPAAGSWAPAPWRESWGFGGWTFGAVALAGLAWFVLQVFLSASDGTPIFTRAGLSSVLSFIVILLIALVLAVVAVAIITAAALPYIGVYRRFSAPSPRGFRFTFPHGTVYVTGLRAATLERRLVIRFLAWRPVWRKRITDGAAAPVLRIRRRRPTIIEIDSIRQLDDWPWEQWLGQGYPPSQRANLLYFHHKRWLIRDIYPASWSNAKYAYQGPAHILAVTPLPEGNAKALHLIGTPVSTRDGLRFRVSMTGTATRSRRGAEVGEVLIGANSMRTPPVVILQADPVDAGTLPLGDDHKKYRNLAHEYLNSGASAVFVIPPLEDKLAATVAKRVESAITKLRRPPRPPVLLLLLSEIKKLVQSASPPAGDGDDPTLDLLLFLNSTH